MDSILEHQRQSLEDVQRFENALSTLLSRSYNVHEKQLQTDHKAAQILDRIQARSLTLSNLLNDEHARTAEVNLLAGSSSSQQNGQQNQGELDEFYARLVKIQEHHSKYPDSIPGGFDLEIAAFLDDEEQIQADEEEEREDPIGLLFSGEESYGKYLDLYANHTAFCNIKNIGKRPGYLQYLDILLAAQMGPIHSDLPKEIRTTKDYENYIQSLHSYLLSFCKRTKPLLNLEAEQRETQDAFSAGWEAGEIPGWEASSAKVKSEDAPEGGIWCSACAKHYSKQTVYDAHLTSKKHIKAAQKSASQANPASTNGTNGAMPPPTQAQSASSLRHRNIALHTYLATSLLVTLNSVLADTKSNVERRFSLTAREREQELLEQANKSLSISGAGANGAANGANGVAGEEEEDEDRIYNPLKLPLGWDGKPIPYWLYKLHGLGVEYRCEICSDQAYMGRKNFERHFQESRHAFGMRALGLPNTKHFHEITRIDDALALADKLKKEGRHEIFEQETMEELEDDDGNVYNRKTYEDLKKQGLI